MISVYQRLPVSTVIKSKIPKNGHSFIRYNFHNKMLKHVCNKQHLFDLFESTQLFENILQQTLTTNSIKKELNK